MKRRKKAKGRKGNVELDQVSVRKGERVSQVKLVRERNGESKRN